VKLVAFQKQSHSILYQGDSFQHVIDYEINDALFWQINFLKKKPFEMKGKI